MSKSLPIDPKLRYVSKMTTKLQHEEGFARSMGERYNQRARLAKVAENMYNELPVDAPERTHGYWMNLDRTLARERAEEDLSQALRILSGGDPSSKINVLLHELQNAASELSNHLQEGRERET